MFGRTTGGVRRRAVLAGAGGAGQVEQVQPFGLVQLQGPGDRVQHIVRDAGDVALLQADVPVGGHPGQDRHLFPPQTGYPSTAAAGRQPGLLRGDLGAAGGQELTDVGSVVHTRKVTAPIGAEGGAVCPPDKRDLPCLAGRELHEAKKAATPGCPSTNPSKEH